MHRANDSRLIFTRKGNLVAIVTGGEATTEHECGIKGLEDTLCHGPETRKIVQTQLEQRVRANPDNPDFSGIVYPDLLESKRIVKRNEGLQFFTIEHEGQELEAVLGYAPYGRDLREVTRISSEPSFSGRDRGGNGPLAFRTFMAGGGDKDITAAWDSVSFAVRVRGKKYVKALSGFYDALLNNKVAFGGSFMQESDEYGYLSGIVLADTRYISDASKLVVKANERKMAASMRLNARSRAAEVREQLRAKGIRDVGYLWPEWLGEIDGPVGYCVNPSPGVNIDRGGPYTEAALLAWADKGGKPRLSRHN